MTSKRLRNTAFGLMALAAFSVYSAAKERPISTGKLLFPLLLSFIAYWLMGRAAKLK